ncbi:type I DNA topoisomerase [bacterium]|nr:type I DNA topoisomerase [bacterium]
MDLVVVESPTKSNTIQKFLGKNYIVKSCFGHIRDLPKRELGVDIENNFKPKYVIPVKARKVIKTLKDALEKSSNVILATDQDREGESIAWHLVEALKLKNRIPYKRIVFSEITEKAIKNALKNPREIDINLVNAQQARRILDRLVGYKLSPFLWKKIARGLSAGRVQSVAVKLVVDRENEIKEFVAKKYWTINALFLKDKIEFEAILAKEDGKPIEKFQITTKKDADKIIKSLKGAEYIVKNIEKKETTKNPLPPFTTSTLQQEAGIRLKFSAKKTMVLAQKLYEKGIITYHRTDSLNLSETSQQSAKEFIESQYGKNYWPGYFRKFKTKSKNAQEAHEAIRPVYPNRQAEKIKLQKKLDTQETRIYDLIWKRFIASQMSEAKVMLTQVDIAAKNFIFKASGQTLKFDGFLKVYPLKFEERYLPNLENKEKLTLKKLIGIQHSTQPPARYSEASLIKTLEKQGIGRPSTYASILDTIQQRNYVVKDENKKLMPTEIGVLTDKILRTNFPEIVDVKFTSKMEELLDLIAQGKESKEKVLESFYFPFEKNIEEKLKTTLKQSAKEKTDKVCPKCGAPLVVKWSKYGKFYSCSNFPKCKYKEPIKKAESIVKCPKCETGEIIEKRTKSGKIFYGCSNYPKCDFALWDRPTGKTCPKCGALLVKTKRGQIKCSNKDCDFVENGETN